jgi:hypothetical protein
MMTTSAVLEKEEQRQGETDEDSTELKIMNVIVAKNQIDKQTDFGGKKWRVREPKSVECNARRAKVLTLCEKGAVQSWLCSQRHSQKH